LRRGTYRRKTLWWFAPVIGWVFARLSFAIPVKRLRETETLLAFYHPKPMYPFHVLLVPKRAASTLKELDPNDATFLTDLYSTVQNLVEEFHLSAYRLIVNGGDYQDCSAAAFSPYLPLARRERDVRRTG
jgi:histidine triad (HIT) family protein